MIYTAIVEAPDHPAPSTALRYLREHVLALSHDENITASFEVFDRVALNGKPLSDRVQVSVIRNLLRDEMQGHTMTKFGYLRSRVIKETGASEDDVHDVVFSRGSKFGSVTVDGAFYVLRPITDIRERLFAEGVARQATRRLRSRLALDDKFNGLNAQQLDAVWHVINKPLTVLVGAAGTGKTKVVRTVAQLAADSGYNVAYTATTASAARVLAGADGKTLHSFLRSLPGNPVSHAPGPVDLLIVDEASMLGTSLASPLGHYLQCGNAQHLVIVGDPYQLPPVGAGAVLRDLIESPVTKRYVRELTEVMRVKSKLVRGKRTPSDIIAAATAIREGAPLPDLATSNEIEVVPVEGRDDYDSAVARIIESIKSREDGNYLIVTAEYASPLGVYQLSRKVRDAVLRCSDDPWLVGERVVQRKTVKLDKANEASPIFANGTFGNIVSIDKDDGSVEVKYEDGSSARWPAYSVIHGRGVIEPAYAMTVHRAQGSQAPLVIVVIDPEAKSMWGDRALGYTAVTRAQERLMIVGDPNALLGSEGANGIDMRRTALPYRLKEYARQQGNVRRVA
jgi:ATP-dependent exoDNAse (exonuclease V) alpha subunit